MMESKIKGNDTPTTVEWREECDYDMQSRLKDNTPLFYPLEEKEEMQDENPGGN